MSLFAATVVCPLADARSRQALRTGKTTSSLLSQFDLLPALASEHTTFPQPRPILNHSNRSVSACGRPFSANASDWQDNQQTFLTVRPAFGARKRTHYVVEGPKGGLA